MDKARDIDWYSDSNERLFNPRLPVDFSEHLGRLLSATPPGFTGHIWLATSGSTGSAKIVALSKTALRISAQAVNDHLEVTAKDSWLLALPNFHVGGLSIYVRAELSRSDVHTLKNSKWSAKEFVRTIEETGATLSALVPTQIFDLIQHGEHAPPNLRAVVVGGGSLGPNLYNMAREMGWPLLPSYGLTEACSQVATASLDSLMDRHLKMPELKMPDLELLPHLEVRGGDEQFLSFKGLSLLTGYLEEDPKIGPVFRDPKVDGWLRTEDRGRVHGPDLGRPHLTIVGRGQDFVKIAGENVDLHRLEDLLHHLCLEKAKSIQAAIAPMPDERLGFKLQLAFSGAEALAWASEIFRHFNLKVAPFEKAEAFCVLEELPLTASGKLQRKVLVETLGRLKLT